MEKLKTITSLEYDLDILKDKHNKINKSYKLISDELNNESYEVGLIRKEKEKLK